MDSINCDECGLEMICKKNSIYCDNCFNKRKNDICELIDANGIRIYSAENLEEFKNYISNMEISVRLDLHGVLDTIDEKEEFENAMNICCISYVGSATKMRLNAREDIKARLKTQLDFGVLVFSRGKGKNKNTFHEEGSKAWVNSLIQTPSDREAIFVDDSYDHENSTKTLKIPNLKTILYDENSKKSRNFRTLHQLIKKFS